MNDHIDFDNVMLYRPKSWERCSGACIQEAKVSVPYYSNLFLNYFFSFFPQILLKKIPHESLRTQFNGII
jgi:capsule polysaccharide modification protein KpsS